MRVLLVEPDYRRGRPKKRTPPYDDEILWYPPLGLMKLARFHKDRGDHVQFVYGCDRSVFSGASLFSPVELWDRVYITTLFTFHFDRIVRTIRFYVDAVGGTISKVFVGGIMASLMAEDIYEKTGVCPAQGLLHNPEDIRLQGDVDIDSVVPDYSILDESLYAINDTYYGYTSRGCPNRCPWCGVSRIEPEYVPYIDIKPMLTSLRAERGDKRVLRLMDNNVLASLELARIVGDLLEMGYGRGQTTTTQPPKQRVIDFNQGLDATHLTAAKMKLLSKLNLRPMRIAFDRIGEERQYLKAVSVAHKYGVPEFSNYMLYNFEDTPRDLYDRLMVNIKLNEEWIADDPDRVAGKVYSYPMRFAPIDDLAGNHDNRHREYWRSVTDENVDWLQSPVWTRRFVRNIEIMKGVAHGAISPTPTLARRAIGASFEEFVANLYMPEELLRNRNKHEKLVYEHEPQREPGSGKVEAFREFILGLLARRDDRFWQFHKAVTANSVACIRSAIDQCEDEELKRWLRLYLKRQK